MDPAALMFTLFQRCRRTFGWPADRYRFMVSISDKSGSRRGTVNGRSAARLVVWRTDAERNS